MPLLTVDIALVPNEMVSRIGCRMAVVVAVWITIAQLPVDWHQGWETRANYGHVDLYDSDYARDDELLWSKVSKISLVLSPMTFDGGCTCKVGIALLV
jgi:hypothetical protein